MPTFSFRLFLVTFALAFVSIVSVYAQAPSHGDPPTEKRKKRIVLGAYVANEQLGAALRYGPFQVLVAGYSEQSGEDSRDWLLHYSGRYNHILIARKRIDFYTFLAGSVAHYEQHSFTILGSTELETIPYKSGVIIAVGAGHGSEFYFMKRREGFSLSVETGIGASLYGGHFKNYPRSLFAAFGLHYHF